jgi:hypothetical protein
MDDLDYILHLAGLPAKELLIESDASMLDEKSPKGFEGTVKAMKKHKDIDNPWALSHWMKNKGYHSHRTKSGKKKRNDECQDETPEQNESVRLDLSSLVETLLSEKWDSDYETPKSKQGMWDGWSKADLEQERSKLRNKDDRSEAESTRLKQVNFALRAKSDWGKA